MRTIKEKLLYKILSNYYQKGLTQQEIARKYNLSRIKVSRSIRKALTDKTVQIKINLPEDPNHELEQKIEEIYGLNEAIVVTASPINTLENLGEAAANYLSLHLQGHEIIGLTWGRSILATIKALSALNYPKIRIVQLLGGLGNPDSDTHGTELAIRLALTLRAKARVLNSPGIVKSREICMTLMDNEQISDTLLLAQNADIALVGIGAMTEKSLIMQSSNIISNDEIRRLKDKGTIGDIGLRFFDQDGKQVSDEINERIVGLTCEQMKKIPRIIGIAGGLEKQNSVMAALKGKCINTLITDNLTANFLISQNSN